MAPDIVFTRRTVPDSLRYIAQLMRELADEEVLQTDDLLPIVAKNLSCAVSLEMIADEIDRDTVPDIGPRCGYG